MVVRYEEEHVYHEEVHQEGHEVHDPGAEHDEVKPLEDDVKVEDNQGPPQRSYKVQPPQHRTKHDIKHMPSSSNRYYF